VVCTLLYHIIFIICYIYFFIENDEMLWYIERPTRTLFLHFFKLLKKLVLRAKHFLLTWGTLYLLFILQYAKNLTQSNLYYWTSVIRTICEKIKILDCFLFWLPKLFENSFHLNMNKMNNKWCNKVFSKCYQRKPTVAAGVYYIGTRLCPYSKERIKVKNKFQYCTLQLNCGYRSYLFGVSIGE